MPYKPLESPQSQARVVPTTEPYPPTPAHDELTEEERVEYEKGILTWSKVRNWRFWIRKEWAWYYVLFVLIVVVVALMAFFHHSVSSNLKKRTAVADRTDHRLVDAICEEITSLEIRMVNPRCDPVCTLIPTFVW